MKIVLATRNNDKIDEIEDLLINIDAEIFALDDFNDLPEIIEDGTSLKENAYKKAKITFEKTGILSLADDTGLEVDALDGKPSVYSSRFAGENASYADNVNNLLKLMEGVPNEQRTARFRCIISIVGDGIAEFAEGVCGGVITDQKRGDNGFGYDPVFLVPQYNRTFSEMSREKKNEISHRGIALKKAKAILKKIAESKN